MDIGKIFSLMDISYTQYTFILSLSNCDIVKIINSESKDKVVKLDIPLTSNQYKIYILTDNKNVLYIGTTKMAIKNRLRLGLKAKKYAYQWNKLQTVNLIVFCFEKMDKEKIENIEAELAFEVRKTTGKWPKFQNEIHFNNLYTQGQIIAHEIFNQLYKNEYSLNKNYID